MLKQLTKPFIFDETMESNAIDSDCSSGDESDAPISIAKKDSKRTKTSPKKSSPKKSKLDKVETGQTPSISGTRSNSGFVVEINKASSNDEELENCHRIGSSGVGTNRDGKIVFFNCYPDSNKLYKQGNMRVRFDFNDIERIYDAFNYFIKTNKRNKK